MPLFQKLESVWQERRKNEWKRRLSDWSTAREVLEHHLLKSRLKKEVQETESGKQIVSPTRSRFEPKDQRLQQHGHEPQKLHQRPNVDGTRVLVSDGDAAKRWDPRETDERMREAGGQMSQDKKADDVSEDRKKQGFHASPGEQNYNQIMADLKRERSDFQQRWKESEKAKTEILEDLEDSKRRFQEKNGQLHLELEQRRQNERSAKTKVNALEDELSRTKKHVDEWRDRYNTVRAHSDSYQAKYEESKLQVRELTEKITTLEEDLIQLRKKTQRDDLKIEALERDKGQMSLKLKDLKSEVEHLDDEKEQRGRIITQLKDEMSVLQTENTELKVKIAGLEERLQPSEDVDMIESEGKRTEVNTVIISHVRFGFCEADEHFVFFFQHLDSLFLKHAGRTRGFKLL